MNTSRTLVLFLLLGWHFLSGQSLKAEQKEDPAKLDFAETCLQSFRFPAADPKSLARQALQWTFQKKSIPAGYLELADFMGEAFDLYRQGAFEAVINHFHRELDDLPADLQPLLIPARRLVFSENRLGEITDLERWQRTNLPAIFRRGRSLEEIKLDARVDTFDYSFVDNKIFLPIVSVSAEKDTLENIAWWKSSQNEEKFLIPYLHRFLDAKNLAERAIQRSLAEKYLKVFWRWFVWTVRPSTGTLGPLGSDFKYWLEKRVPYEKLENVLSGYGHHLADYSLVRVESEESDDDSFEVIFNSLSLDEQNDPSIWEVAEGDLTGDIETLPSETALFYIDAEFALLMLTIGKRWNEAYFLKAELTRNPRSILASKPAHEREDLSISLAFAYAYQTKNLHYAQIFAKNGFDLLDRPNNANRAGTNCRNPG